MKLLIITFAFLSFAGVCSGQYKNSFNWDYYNQLSEEANKEYPNSTYNIIDIDSLNNAIFEFGNVKIKIDTLSNWKLLFEYSYRWEHIVGKEVPSINLISDSLELPKKNVKYAYYNSKIYSGIELFDGLKIDSAFLKKGTDSLKGFPAIYERDNPLNRVWIPFVSNDYLILRYVHSYPHGNLTSFYNEIVLYFKRE